MTLYWTAVIVALALIGLEFWWLHKHESKRDRAVKDFDSIDPP